MAKNKIGLELKGFEDLIERMETSGADVREAVEGSLRVAENIVAKNAKAAMRKHRHTGETERSIIRKSKPKWEGTTAEVGVGFDIKNGGLPSIFLMYGTPRHAKDEAVYNAVYGKKTRSQIAKTQAQIFTGMIKKKLGG